MAILLDILANSDRPLVADGAMGTLLHSRGAHFEQCFDELNVSWPDLVEGVHLEYIQAGAQLIKTNTFGANRYKLARHGLQDRLEEINAAGVARARRVIQTVVRPVLVAGDIGPLGVRLAPFGRVKPEQAREAFTEQAAALARAGVDLLLLETFSDVAEICEAVAAARQAAPELPVVASMTFTRDDRTLLGDGPAGVARAIAAAGADVIGVNCSGGPAQLLRILRQMRAAAPRAYFSVMPNAGWPEQSGGRIMYPAGPDYFGEAAVSFWDAGAKILGGCCGTTPQHIASIRAAISRVVEQSDECRAVESVSLAAVEPVETGPAEQPTGLAQKLAAGKFVVAVEMDPPRGLATHKVIAGASLLAEAGADVIDVADSPMARMRMSPWAVCSLIQRQVGCETVLHFPTRGRNLLRVQGDLLAAHALGVRNVFVVMGDPTAIGDYPNAMDNYDLVPSGLIKLIKQNFNAGVDHAGSEIGQPTSFFVGCALSLNPSDPAAEIKNLKRKLQAGADFLLTQPVFDAAPARDFLQRVADESGPLGVPLICGILPLAGVRHANFLHHEVPGVSIPESTRARLEQGGENATGVGVEIALELVRQCRPFAQGIYIMPPFGRYDVAAEIIDAVRQEH
jgi:homocysteine S-methyltransferase